MVDYNQTFLKSIISAVNQLRFRAQNDTVRFKNILYGIILHDMIDWANYIGDKETSSKLSSILGRFLTCSCAFDVVQMKESLNARAYINVNVSQTNSTFDRVVDNDGHITVTKLDEQHEPIEEDPTYIRKFVFYPETIFGKDGKAITITTAADGSPVISSFNSLTTGQKMDIYINKETWAMYAFDENGVAHKLNQTDLDTIHDRITTVEEKIPTKVGTTVTDEGDGTQTIITDFDIDNTEKTINGDADIEEVL